MPVWVRSWAIQVAARWVDLVALGWSSRQLPLPWSSASRIAPPSPIWSLMKFTSDAGAARERAALRSSRCMLLDPPAQCPHMSTHYAHITHKLNGEPRSKEMRTLISCWVWWSPASWKTTRRWRSFWCQLPWTATKSHATSHRFWMAPSHGRWTWSNVDSSNSQSNTSMTNPSSDSVESIVEWMEVGLGFQQTGRKRRSPICMPTISALVMKNGQGRRIWHHS